MIGAVRNPGSHGRRQCWERREQHCEDKVVRAGNFMDCAVRMTLFLSQRDAVRKEELP